MKRGTTELDCCTVLSPGYPPSMEVDEGAETEELEMLSNLFLISYMKAAMLRCISEIAESLANEPVSCLAAALVTVVLVFLFESNDFLCLRYSSMSASDHALHSSQRLLRSHLTDLQDTQTVWLSSRLSLILFLQERQLRWPVEAEEVVDESMITQITSPKAGQSEEKIWAKGARSQQFELLTTARIE